MTREEKIAKLMGVIVSAPMDLLNRIETAVTAKPDDEAHAKSRDTRLVTVSGASRLLGLSRTTVYSLVKTGRLAAVELNGSSKITMQSVSEFLDGKRPPNEMTDALIAGRKSRKPSLKDKAA